MDVSAHRRNFILGVLIALSQFFIMLGQALPIARGQGSSARWFFAVASGCLMLVGILLAVKNRKQRAH